MKLRTMAIGRLIELVFGAVLPTLFIVPFMGTMLFLGIGRFSMEAMPLLLLSSSVLGAVAILWVLILFGAEQVNRVPSLRIASILFGVLGYIAVALLFMSIDPSELRLGRPLEMSWWHIRRGDDGRLLVLGIAGPFVLGFGYLFRLIRGR